MKLATLKNNTRDGCLVVVSSDLRRCVAVPDIATSLQASLDDWERCAPKLARVHAALNAQKLAHSQPFDSGACHSPLPRAYQWADGSAHCCVAEVRMYETIETGEPVTPFMRFGDQVRIQMQAANSDDIFGVIEQTVMRRPGTE